MADISKITLPNDSKYNLKDAVAREKLEILDNAVENHGIGYIEETNVILPEADISPYWWEESWARLNIDIPIVIGKTYRVTFAGNTYQYTAVEHYGVPFIPFEAEPSLDGHYSGGVFYDPYHGSGVQFSEYAENPPSEPVSIAIEIVGETAEYPEKIDTQFLPYGDEVESAVVCNGMGFFGNPIIIADIITPNTNAWQDDGEGGWVTEIPNIGIAAKDLDYQANYQFSIHYGNYIIIGKNTSFSSGPDFSVNDTYIEPTCTTSGGIYIHFNASTDVLSMNVWGEIPRGAYPLKIAYYDFAHTIDLMFLPTNIPVEWISIANKPSVISNCITHATYYGYCTSGGSTAAKTVTISDFTSLTTGVTVRVRFASGNTASNPTLKVNSTTAKAIYRLRGDSAVAAGSGAWEAGEVVDFVYDGSYWVMVNGGEQDRINERIAKTDIATSVSSSSTDSQVPSAKLFYDTIGNVETVLETLLEGTSS